MSYYQPLESLNIELPISLGKIWRSYDVELGIYRSRQTGIIVNAAWVFTLSIITQVCRVCGSLRKGPFQPLSNSCLRHSWDTPASVLIIGGTGETLDDAIASAGNKANTLLQSPESDKWKVNLYLDREEYIFYRYTLFQETKELISVYEQLDADAQKTLLRFAKTLRQGDEPRIIGGT